MKLLLPPRRRRRADAEHVDQRPAGVANRFEDFPGTAPPVVFDDDAGAGTEVGLDERVGAAGIAGDDVHAGVVETAGERPVFDDELDLEAGRQDFVQHPDDQLVLTDG